MSDEQFLKHIMEQVEKYFLKNEKPHTILQEDEYYKEIMTLYAKQHNLLESTLILLNNNNVEEAYILVRSALNNYFLIGYLINDSKDRERLKKYKIQPVISHIRQLKKILEILESHTFKDTKGIKEQYSIEKINKKIKELKRYLHGEGFKEKEQLLSIVDLAKNAYENVSMLYISLYSEASKYEHSDISSLDIYRTQINEEYPNNIIFILNLNKTDDELKKKLYFELKRIYCDTFMRIATHIVKNAKHLERNYDMHRLSDIANQIERSIINVN